MEPVDIPPNYPLRAELDRLPLAQLVARLEQADPDAASRVDKGNSRRLTRAIEIPKPRRWGSRRPRPARTRSWTSLLTLVSLSGQTDQLPGAN